MITKHHTPRWLVMAAIPFVLAWMIIWAIFNPIDAYHRCVGTEGGEA